MNAFLWLGILLVLGGISGYIGWTLGNPGKLISAKEERRWQQLAKSLELSFISGGDANEIVVSGPYQGHQLALRAQLEDLGGISTFVSLNRTQPPKERVDKGSILHRLEKLAQTPSLKGQLEIGIGGDVLFYRQAGFETDPTYLHTLFKLLHDLLRLHTQTVQLGGEAISTLLAVRQNSTTFRQILTQMIVHISYETRGRLEKILPEVWCPHCLARFKIIEIEPVELNYYGCRVCGQSREVLHLKRGLVALLNNQEKQAQIPDQGSLKVNWLLRQALFDFERVEIVQASDEEVERFAVQVGNDTDETRRERYKKMPCWVLPGCELSVNTIRILDHIFGEIRLS